MKPSVCPICNNKYVDKKNHPNKKTRHHIFCRQWYRDSTLTVDVCRSCHDDFNRDYQNMATRRWSKKECLFYWIKFCLDHKVLVYKVYPCLRKYKEGLEL